MVTILSCTPAVIVEQGSVERMSQLEQDGGQVAQPAQRGPEWLGSTGSYLQPLAQHGRERGHALAEAVPSPLQATFFVLCGWRFGCRAGIGLSVEMLFHRLHRDGPVGQELVRQHADRVATGQAQETRNVFLGLVIAVGVTLIKAMNMHGVVGVQRAGRAVSLKT